MAFAASKVCSALAGVVDSGYECACRQMEQGVKRPMPIQITRRREQEGIQILDLKGSLVFGEEDLECRDELDRIIGARKARIILKLKDLGELDTTGLATLVYYALVKVPMEQGKLVLCELRTLHTEMLDIIITQTLLEVFRSEEDAVDSFFPGRYARRHYLLAFAKSEESQHPMCRDLPGLNDDA